ncbi:MAG: hypothetical protein WDM70_10245 [Nitrosomonadales bacterium]
MDAESIVEDFRRYFSHTLGRDALNQANYYVYTSLSLSLRDRLVERWNNTKLAYSEQDCKRTYYLSLEFLMGRALGNAMLNLEVESSTADALGKLGLALEEIIDQEHDARPGQWRFRTAGSLFSGQLCHLTTAGERLWSAIRVWNVPSKN